MKSGTLKGKICRSCGEMFRRGVDNKVKTSYCTNCHVMGWQEEMYNRGCNVIHPGNIGKQCHTIPLKLKDCPKLVVDGTTYRVTNDLLYEDTKYRKTYPTKEEWNKIREYEYRKAKAIADEKERIKERERIKEEVRVWTEKRKIEMAKLAKETRERVKIERAKEQAQAERKAKVDARKEKTRAESEAFTKRKNEIKERVLKELQGGALRKDLIKKCGYTKYEISSALDALHENGRWIKLEKVRYTKQEDELIIQMRKDGAKFKEIGEFFGKSTTTISNRYQKLKRKGLVD